VTRSSFVKGASSLSIVHYPLSIAFRPKNSPNLDRIPRRDPVPNPAKQAELIPVTEGFVPVKYRLSTGYDRLHTGYGQLRKVTEASRPFPAGYQPMPNLLQPGFKTFKAGYPAAPAFSARRAWAGALLNFEQKTARGQS
jgi:hypothetical protein